jgi:5-methylcytosine-specific restriction endonuclease McrA/urease beta subunit
MKEGNEMAGYSSKVKKAISTRISFNAKMSRRQELTEVARIGNVSYYSKPQVVDNKLSLGFSGAGMQGMIREVMYNTAVRVETGEENKVTVLGMVDIGSAKVIEDYMDETQRINEEKRLAKKEKKRKNAESKYIKDSSYSVAEIHNKIKQASENKEKYMDFNGKKAKTSSGRYQNFIENGVKCVECGLVGTHYWLESNTIGVDGQRSWHLNLYGVNKQGHEIMLTKDHIHPKSKGGKNHISNYQPMCSPCNQAKGDILIVKGELL